MKRRLLTASLAAMTLITTGAIGASAFAEVNRNNSQTIAANSYSHKNFCPSGEESIATKVRISAETKGFYLNICKGQDKNSGSYYVGSAKNTKGYIFLPLLRAKKGFYSAVNKQYTYALDLNQKYLRVYKSGKLILQEKIYNVHYF